AIVATVQTKRAPVDLPQGEALPESLSGVPVDVREARPYQRLRAADPLAAQITQTYRRPEQAEPEWPLERELPSGELLTSPNRKTKKRLAAQLKFQLLGESARKAHQQKPMLNYAPVGCPPLAPVNVTATITAAVSPDTGLAILTKFLNGTQSSLVVGMY